MSGLKPYYTRGYHGFGYYFTGFGNVITRGSNPSKSQVLMQILYMDDIIVCYCI